MRYWLLLVLAVLLGASSPAAQPAAQPATAESSADTVLLDAAASGDAEAVRDALVAGASPEATNASGATALMLATCSGNLDAVRALVDAGADPSRKGVVWLNSKRTSCYGNLTGIAASEGHIDVLSYLLDDLSIPADDRERDSATGDDTGWTALQRAASAGQTETVTMLVERGAVVDRAGDMLLVLAIGNGHRDTTERLLAAGAPVADAGPDGMTALHWAVLRVRATWAHTLLEAGADVNATSSDGNTPLDLAALVGDEEFARRLLCAGATRVETALKAAQRRNHEAVIQLLGHADREGHPYTQTCAQGRARALNQQVVALYGTGRYAEAIPLAVDALSMREQVLGSNHLDVAESLNNLALLRWTIGEYSEARRLNERALTIRENLLGPHHPEVAISLQNLALVLQETGDYRGARVLYERALAILGDKLGPDLAVSLNNFGGLLRVLGDYAEAQDAYERSLAMRETLLGPAHPDVATSLNDLAGLFDEMGSYAEARVLFERAVKIQEGALGPEHPYVAISLANLASLLQETGAYLEAQALHERVLAIMQTALGPDHPEVATSLSNLAGLLQAMGDYERARTLFDRALAIQEPVFGSAHPDVATSLSNLAGLYEAMGAYAEARPLYERALAIREATFGPGHPTVASSLSDLALLARVTGDYARAQALHEQAAAIREAALGPDHPTVAVSLNNLAGLLRVAKEYAEARRLYERVLALKESRFGSDHPSVALSLNDLAVVLDETGDYAGARALYERALSIREEAFGPEHRAVAITLHNLAGLLHVLGHYAEAQSMHERALAIRETVMGLDHPDVALSLNGLAALLDETGDHAGARRLYERAGRTRDVQLLLVLPTLSFAEQVAYLQADVATQTSILLFSHRTPEHLRIAYPLLARWKGLLLHSLRTQTAVNALAADPAHADDVAMLRAVRTNLVAWQDGAGSVPLADWQAQRDALTAEKERLERALAGALPEDVFTDPLRADSFPGLAAHLAPGEAFADAFRYRHYERAAFVEHRYAVVLSVPGDADPVLVDLGNADDLDAAVAAWRTAVTAGSSATVEHRTLVERLWAPLHDALPEGTTRLWFSPDGTLARLPLSVFAESDAHTVDLRVTQVASARALVRLRTYEREAAPDGLLLAGGIDFGTNADGAARPWLPLPGTAAEVDALAAFADEADLPMTVLSGTEADPAAVTAALPEARYVHLATHGFFAALHQPLLDDLAARDTGLGRSGGLARRTPRERRVLSRNPLVESGLALSGANADAAETGASGTLTAEELVGLDLGGTELVVLSACETGRGSEVTGQGVLGLQASFLAAGVRTLLMSLWKVPDASTAVLMEAFYARLWQDGMRPAEALHRAQTAVRAAGYTEPLHWAGWVLAGEAW